MSGSSRDSLKTALEKVERAVQMDRAGRPSQAYSLYMASLDLFLAALKQERNKDTKALIRLRMTEYLERAEQLKAQLNSPDAVSDLSSSSAAAPSAPPFDGGFVLPSVPNSDPADAAVPQQPLPQPQPSAPPFQPPPPPQQPQPRQRSHSTTYYGELIRQTLAVESIVAECRRTRSKFVDPLFPAATSSLFKGAPPSADAAELAQRVVWRRATDTPGAVLSRSGATSHDVIQGSLGDCWLLGALSLVATRPDKIVEVIPFFAIDQGVFVVRFYRNRTRIDVVVDDLLPCLPSGEPVFAHNRGFNEFWVSIVEKAMAKISGSYYALESGNESDALVDFTGGVSFTLMLKEAQAPPDRLWQLLASYQQHGYLMGCANNRAQEEMGIVPSHAYGILGMHQLGGGAVKLVCVRNPWGEREWCGPWADNTAQWDRVSPAERAAVGYKPDANDGTFFMEIRDFMAHFEKIYLCKTLPQGWTQASIDGAWEAGRSAGGCTNCVTWMWNPQYLVRVDRPTSAFLVLSQGDARKYGNGGGGSGGYENSIGVTVLSAAGRPPTGLRVLAANDESVKLIERIAYANTRERSMALTLDPAACPYVVVPATFEPGCAARFRLSVFAEPLANVSVSPVAEWPHVREVRGAWTPALSGGCSNNAGTWRRNPRYGVRVAGDGVLALRLSSVMVSVDIERAPAVGLYVLGDGSVALTDEIVASSRSFSQHALLRATLPPATQRPFTLLCATFEPGFVGDFLLSIFSTAPVELWAL